MTTQSLEAPTVEEPEQPTPTELPACPKCGSEEPWGRSSWCPSCGYFPVLGEQQAGDELFESQEDDVNDSVREAIPPWMWLAGGVSVFIIIESFIGGIMLDDESPYLALWSLLQIGLGVVVLGIAQITSFLFAVRVSGTFGPMDIIMKPIEIWRPTIHALPNTANRICLAIWGPVAIACSFGLLGGVNLESLWKNDWGVKKRAKRNLVQAIVSEARKERAEDGSLEDAMKGLTGEDEAEQKMKKTDCLVLGYTANEAGEFRTLLLAAAPRRKLQYVGSIGSNQLTPEQRREIDRRMRLTPKRQTPFAGIHAPYAGVWLEPVVMCRIEHKDWSSTGILLKSKFMELLAANTGVHGQRPKPSNEEETP